jgi:REP-associated tyrosine transposase
MSIVQTPLRKPAPQERHVQTSNVGGKVMANTYKQIYVQVVFAVQGRQNLIKIDHKEELHKYITGIVRNHEQKLIAVNAMPDHVHTLIGLKPA